MIHNLTFQPPVIQGVLPVDAHRQTDRQIDKQLPSVFIILNMSGHLQILIYFVT